MSQVMPTLLIRIRLRAGWRGAWWGGWSSRGRVLLVTILETSCLGCFDPLHSPSMAVPLIVGLCLALAEDEDISEVYMKSWQNFFYILTEHFILFTISVILIAFFLLDTIKRSESQWTHIVSSGFIWAALFKSHQIFQIFESCTFKILTSSYRITSAFFWHSHSATFEIRGFDQKYCLIFLD